MALPQDSACRTCAHRLNLINVCTKHKKIIKPADPPCPDWERHKMWPPNGMEDNPFKPKVKEVQGKKSPVSVRQVVEAVCDKGMSLAEAGKVLGCTRHVVFRRIRQAEEVGLVERVSKGIYRRKVRK